MNNRTLIPRRTLFRYPERTTVTVSPDGSSIAFLAPENGALNVWVAPRQSVRNAKCVTHGIGRPVQQYWWAYDSRHILFLKDLNGDESSLLHCVDIASELDRTLTPIADVRVQLLKLSEVYPEEVVVGVNDRNPQRHDVYRINIVTGRQTLLEQNDRFTGFLIDDAMELRVAFCPRSDGAIDVYRRTGEGAWNLAETIGYEDTGSMGIVGFDATGEAVYLSDSRDRNTAALCTWNLSNGVRTMITAHPKADISSVVMHPREKSIQAVSFVYQRREWRPIDSEVTSDFEYLNRLDAGDYTIDSASMDDRYWLVTYESDNRPPRCYVYDHETGKSAFLFSHYTSVADLPLSEMHSAVVKSRDGLDLVLYYTLPTGSDTTNGGVSASGLPTVLIPHGGPWQRDIWGFNLMHQWLANRGYAVLSVNYRGSTGFGKLFANAGDRQWGGAVIDDQEDAIRWATRRGFADPERIAIFGASFGGYSALLGMAREAQLYACGISVSGPTDLTTLIQSVSPSWRGDIPTLLRRIGDPTTEGGRKALNFHSPSSQVEKITRPLLMIHGANDSLVARDGPDEFAAQLHRKGRPVTYAVFGDEGHQFAHQANIFSFYAVVEAFLARHLGGRYEPIGNDLTDSSLNVLYGAAGIPRLEQAMSALPQHDSSTEGRARL